MRHRKLTIVLTLAGLLFSITGIARGLINQSQTWQREFRFPLMHGEIAISGSEFELKFDSLMTDDVINVQAAENSESRICFYALGLLRYDDPNARMMVEDARGVDSKSVANGSGWLSIQRPADRKTRLFAHIVVPAGIFVRLTVAGRTIMRGRVVKGICLGNGTAWTPYNRPRYVMMHAMLRQTFNLPARPGAVATFQSLTLRQGEKQRDPSTPFSDKPNDDEWIAIELYIAKDGKVLRAEPLIGSEDVLDRAVQLTHDWQFEGSHLPKKENFVRTVVMFASKGGGLYLSSVSPQ